MKQIILIFIVSAIYSCKTYYIDMDKNVVSKSMTISLYDQYNELYYFNPINGSADNEIFYNTHFTMKLPKGIIYWMRSGNHFFYEYDSKQIIYIYNPFRNDDKDSGQWRLEEVQGDIDYNLEQYWVGERKYKENYLYKNHKNRVAKIYTDGKYQILLYNIKSENFENFLELVKTFKVQE